MDLYFERGDGDTPKGHALVFFRRKFDPATVLATYVIALPIKVDVSKYIPPMFAGKMQDMLTNDLAGFAFPPMPEKIDDLEHIRRMAEARDDDLIDGGSVDDSDPMDLIQVVSEVQQEYSGRWERSMQARTPLPSQSVNELIYDLMGERDKLSELAKLAGKLRFAAEGTDRRMVREIEEEIATLARFLPEHYRIPLLVRATVTPTPAASVLAQLYLERCYKLLEEDYRRLQEVEKEIQRLEEAMEP